MSSDNSKDETKFPYRLLLTDTTVLRLSRAPANNLWTNVKLSKTHKLGQSGGSLYRLLGPLLKLFCLL